MTFATILAKGTVIGENWWRSAHQIPLIANPDEWTQILNNRFSCSLHNHHGIIEIFKEVTHAAH